MTITIYTAQMSINDPDAIDITVKGDKAGACLAPTWELVGGHKAAAGHEKFVGKHKPLTDEEYTEAYKELLRERYRKDKQQFLDLLNRERLVLKCYCNSNPDTFCHRHIAKNILRQIAHAHGIQTRNGGELLNYDYSKREAAIIQAWAIAQKPPATVCYLDTETTGADPESDEPVTIGIIDGNGDVLMNVRLNPSVPIHPDAEMVHGISAEMVANCPTFRDIADDLNAIVSKRLVVVYNAKFDVNLLLTAARRQGVFLTIPTFVCAQDIFARWNGHYSAYHRKFIPRKLTEACESLGIQVEDAHDALGDVQMTRALIHALGNQKAWYFFPETGEYFQTEPDPALLTEHGCFGPFNSLEEAKAYHRL